MTERERLLLDLLERWRRRAREAEARLEALERVVKEDRGNVVYLKL